MMVSFDKSMGLNILLKNILSTFCMALVKFCPSYVRAKGLTFMFTWVFRKKSVCVQRDVHG